MALIKSSPNLNFTGLLPNLAQVLDFTGLLSNLAQVVDFIGLLSNLAQVLFSQNLYPGL